MPSVASQGGYRGPDATPEVNYGGFMAHYFGSDSKAGSFGRDELQVQPLPVSRIIPADINNACQVLRWQVKSASREAACAVSYPVMQKPSLFA